MPRLSKTEMAQHRNWLTEWRPPAEMAAYVAAVSNAMGSADFFRQGGVEFLRDAWLAAQFGRHRRSRFTRLIPERERWPDFDAWTDEEVERIECVEADLPGRRRGDEYRLAAGGIEHDPVEDWIARADKAPAALSAAVATKINKHYVTSSASLLVSLNIGEFGIRQEEIETAMASAMQPALSCFERAWVLWEHRLYGPWTARLHR